MKTQSEKQKLQWFFGSLAVIALVINMYFALSRGVFCIFSVARTAPQPPPQAPQATSGTQIISMGIIVVDTNVPTELSIGPGESWMASPVENVAYDRYTNGVFYQHTPVSKPGDSSPPKYEGPDVRKVGFLLSPDHDMIAVRFAYVKYRGKATPDHWYSHALMYNATPLSTGFFTITTDEWLGLSCFNLNKTITYYVLTDGVSWQVRFDRDTNKIYTLHPRNGNGRHEKFQIPYAPNRTEWRVEPGQKTTRADIQWFISERIENLN